MTARLGVRPLKSRQTPGNSQDMLSKAPRPSPGSTQPPTWFSTGSCPLVKTSGAWCFSFTSS